MLIVASVNGIRAAVRKGLASWLTRAAPDAVRVGGIDPAFDGSGRWVEVDLPGVTVCSLYMPNGTVGTPKQDEKDRFLALFAPHLAERREKSAAEDREVLVCGDWNIAPPERDIRNWRGNVKLVGPCAGDGDVPMRGHHP